MEHLIAVLIVAVAVPFVFRAVDYFAVLVYILLLALAVFYVQGHSRKPPEIAAAPRMQAVPEHRTAPQPVAFDNNAGKLACESREHQPCSLYGGVWLSPRQFAPQ